MQVRGTELPWQAELGAKMACFLGIRAREGAAALKNSTPVRKFNTSAALRLRLSLLKER